MTVRRSLKDGPPERVNSLEIVELSGSGHRLWYVALLLAAAAEQGRSVRLTVDPQVVGTPGWGEFIEPVLGRPSVEVELCTDSRRQILQRAMRNGTGVVIPDGDCWIGALLTTILGRQTLSADLLIMRPFPESGLVSRGKHVVKRCAWLVAARGHSYLAVHRLVAVSGDSVRDVPDPIIFRAAVSNREDWFRQHDLDPSRRWLVVLGELSRRKYLPEIVEAMASDRVQASNWGLIGVGRVDPDLRLDLSPRPGQDGQRISIRDGFVSDQDFDSWVTHADAVAVLHRNEGSSGVLLKCWAAGTMVLAGGAKSVVSAAQQLTLGGRQIATVSPESIADAMLGIDLEQGSEPAVPSQNCLIERNRQFASTLLGNRRPSSHR